MQNKKNMALLIKILTYRFNVVEERAVQRPEEMRTGGFWASIERKTHTEQNIDGNIVLIFPVAASNF